ncbi:LysO family transporter [Sporanaerobacter acetigenes]|uniref:Lysine exporter LysO n=1 Tax=Sporanaerobacter acetigenes DSM 13106 TaxID=1123281 RepID=A0A1M5UCA6_9FIRM|nr:LysO family transporter [Sporanaerobacter acetigenes]SHH60654.1 Membrane protein of unknown function [Sporanaerobacter acetigenes DSM 13106]
MGVRLILYLALLIIGGMIGYKDLISEKFNSKLGIIQNICLLFLLFIMGIRIGLDDKVISSFFTIGAKALLLAVFSIVFSVFFVRLVRKFIIADEEEKSHES